jgi:hypothetical protein
MKYKVGDVLVNINDPKFFVTIVGFDHYGYRVRDNGFHFYLIERMWNLHKRDKMSFAKWEQIYVKR